ncbi:hydroxymyristoyl-ACP dehydratase [Clostridium aceticum]|uniref:hydroxymyristoyl-ACP dehydratase n=1 Tax=Clostridium aceticum TaxID=84022 RepID=UPI000B18439E|nr:hydroxymyristoyl-ACP dehydratase [Clostridium aceticum]
MITIFCNHSCVYENEGTCTLTHITSASELSDRSCAYYKQKGDETKKSNKI